MTGSEIPAQTEAQQIIGLLEDLNGKADSLIAAVNSLGEGQTWIIDNVKDIFEMFHSPALLGMLGGMGGMPMPDDITPNPGMVIPGMVEHDG